MKKVIIIGCSGSGKTTFAQRLSEITALPLYHLDAIWHKPDKSHISREEFDNRLADIFTLNEWILDGNYNRTLETRLAQCDTVFLFDLPTEICLQGATERLCKKRCDLPFVENELSPELKQTIESFPQNSLPKIYSLVQKYKKDKQIIIFRSRIAADDFLQNLFTEKHCI